GRGGIFRGSGQDCRQGCPAEEDHLSGRLRIGDLPPYGGTGVCACASGPRAVPGSSRRPARTCRSDCPPQVMKVRLDRLLVERGLAESREKAQALVMAGAVVLNGQKASK